MKQLIWIVVLFAIAIGLAIMATTYSGNVFIMVETHLIRINLHAFILGLIIAVFVLYLLIKLLIGILTTPEKLSLFGSRRKGRKATETLNAAGLAFFEGRYQDAEQLTAKLLKNKEVGKNRVLALMLGAHAADQSGNVALRDEYLAEIAKLPEKQQLSRYLLVAESAINAQDHDKAEHNLKAAAQINPRLTRLVRLQLRQAAAQNQPLLVLDKIDKLNRAGAMGQSEVNAYTEQAYRSLIDMVSDAASIKACLKRIPEAHQYGALSVSIAQKYVSLGLYGQAVDWVNKHYPTNQNADLLPSFVQSVPYLDEYAQRKAIDTADAWLKHNPDDAKLLMHLGELAYSQQLWGKAKAYLEASLAISPSNVARLVLAKVLEQMNETQQAVAQRRLVLDNLAENETA
ncbi:MAG: heme biosynthesis HemY N-terminal domain-containing protein [Alysiella sp.]|uniref:heme biosynthesis HemY N-terminal domain-containing protein n=1 Tax=Alysiella sp. TaxID=1872483 RepID=UPI0026DB29BC|nr:heme biosynthesis HemY N-terminal domain-containing protein [Alysiella sp.]MDO4433384.1 heme biosynthesis HemY N-terminal domain-containing protein [Alysiella sp.]